MTRPICAPYRPVRRDRPPPEVPRPVCTCGPGVPCTACQPYAAQQRQHSVVLGGLTRKLAQLRPRLDEEERVLALMRTHRMQTPEGQQAKQAQRHRVENLQASVRNLEAKIKALRAKQERGQ